MHRYMLIITELWSEVPETSQNYCRELERKKLHAIEWLSHHKSMMLGGGVVYLNCINLNVALEQRGRML